MALEDLYGKILAMGAQVIREQTALPALVNHETVGDRAQGASRGGITEVIVPPEFATRDVVPGPTPPASQAAPNPTTVKIPLNYWKEVNFPLTEKHITLMENAGEAIPLFLRNAIAPIVEDMTDSIAILYKGLYGFVGTLNQGGTAFVTPFGTSVAEVQALKKTLTQQKCPRFMRRLALNTDAYGNATGLEAFRSYMQFGSDRTVREGEIDRAYGFDWYEDVGLDGLTHTTGAAGTVLIDNVGGYAAGATTLHLDGLTAKAAVGDIFTIAGHEQTYTVLSCTNLVGTDADVVIRPALRSAVVDNAAVSFKLSHDVSLAFNPYCFAFDSRPASRVTLPGVTSNFMTFVDDMTGVALRLEIKDEYHQLGFYLSCLWGAELIDARLGCRLAG